MLYINRIPSVGLDGLLEMCNHEPDAAKMRGSSLSSSLRFFRIVTPVPTCRPVTDSPIHLAQGCLELGGSAQATRAHDVWSMPLLDGCVIYDDGAQLPIISSITKLTN